MVFVCAGEITAQRVLCWEQRPPQAEEAEQHSGHRQGRSYDGRSRLTDRASANMLRNNRTFSGFLGLSGPSTYDKSLSATRSGEADIAAAPCREALKYLAGKGGRPSGVALLHPAPPDFQAVRRVMRVVRRQGEADLAAAPC
ncbi:MAG: hypothetical protein OHK0039_23620 [Bacteroidia bacterium]